MEIVKNCTVTKTSTPRKCDLCVRSDYSAEIFVFETEMREQEASSEYSSTYQYIFCLDLIIMRVD